ncbi:hypothetical protein F2Q69_00022535 [Brassica cretica]|uniref:Uncharacterized protein n=1 Tax=Brassica cretica TaxID=69181 RepID=A0A8S9QLU2_BRACR|nr:hypothetical protein F2Q69_00022535 [Brassica cretica]
MRSCQDDPLPTVQVHPNQSGPWRQMALLELRWIERIVKRCGMALDIPTI